MKEAKEEHRKFNVTAVCSCVVEAVDEDEAIQKAEAGEFVENEHSYVTGWEYKQFSAELAGDL
jgi:hypothetical protein